MLTKIIMPSGGQTTSESVILKWYKEIGDNVKRGDVLFEIETDKATLEVESYGEGILLEKYYNEGDLVESGETVAYVGKKGEKPPEKTKKLQDSEEDEYQPIMSEKMNENVKTGEDKEIDSNKSILASPAARFLAKSKKVRLDDVFGYLSKKPLKNEDIASYLNTHKETNDECYYMETTSMRRVIAKHMLESVNTAPHFTVSVDIDMSECIRLRQELNTHLQSKGIKVSFNDIIIKYAGKVIESYPLINSVYGDEKIKICKNVNFGLAVSIEGGLVVPVVKHVEKKSISRIAEENTKNIDKAKNGKLVSEEMQRSTITLSNLGMLGADRFTAIINQPESCILAAGQIALKPSVVGGEIVPRQMMTITASFDHRVIDGAVGAAFLRELKLMLEKPFMLLA